MSDWKQIEAPRWSARRIGIALKLWWHCLTRFHAALTFWTKDGRVIYACWSCETNRETPS